MSKPSSPTDSRGDETTRLNAYLHDVTWQMRRNAALRAMVKIETIVGVAVAGQACFLWQEGYATLVGRVAITVGFLVGSMLILGFYHLLWSLFSISQKDAAQDIEKRFPLNQQLITAEELLRTKQTGPMVKAVFTRTLTALKQHTPSIPLWTTSHRWPATLGLVVLCSLIFSLLPAPMDPAVTSAIDQIDGYSQVKREAVAGELQAALRAEDVTKRLPEDQIEKLRQMAMAMKQNDPEQYRKLLEQLHDKGAWKVKLPEKLAGKLGLAKNPVSAGTKAEVAKPAGGGDGNKPTQRQGAVAVIPAGSAANIKLPTDEGDLQFGPPSESDWSAVKAEARKSLNGTDQPLPLEYQQLIRRFYDIKPGS